MLIQYVVIPVLCACVCFTLGAYLLVRHPKLVERYAKWFGSLSSNSHTMFASLFGALTLLEIFDRFWFGVAVFGTMTCAYAYFAVQAPKKPVVEKAESA
jgi:hypothetical protein